MIGNEEEDRFTLKEIQELYSILPVGVGTRRRFMIKLKEIASRTQGWNQYKDGTKAWIKQRGF